MTNNIIKMQDAPSIIENFPDVIKCNYNSNKEAVFILHGVEPNNFVRYDQVFNGSRYIRFNLDGTYHSRAGYDGLSKGCEGRSINELYNGGRAFNLVNDPKQQEEIQKLKEENNLLKNQIEKITEESNSRFKLLEDIIKQLQESVLLLQENISKAITSDDCFKIFKQKNVEMCIEGKDTRITSLPLFTVVKSNHCIAEEDVFSICIDKFEEKGIVPCGETPEYKMFE